MVLLKLACASDVDTTKAPDEWNIATEQLPTTLDVDKYITIVETKESCRLYLPEILQEHLMPKVPGAVFTPHVNAGYQNYILPRNNNASL